MKICFVTQKYPPSPRSGSIGAVMQQLALGLASEGHQVRVITRADSGQAQSQKNEGAIVVHRIRPSASRLWGFWKLESLYPVLFWLKYSRAVSNKLQELIHQGAVELVVSAEYAAETWHFARSCKSVPLVVSLHGPSFVANRLNARFGINTWLQNWLERALIERADALHAVSAHLARTVAGRCRLSQRINIIHNPIDARLFHPNGKEDHKLEQSVLYVGRLERLKGVEILAKAIPLVHRARPEVQFIFIGKDVKLPNRLASMRQKLQQLIGPSMNRVSFIEQIKREELVQHYHESTCCAFPSFSEGLPMVTLEAMACGRPVIGTFGTGHAEIIENRVNGLLVKAGNVEDLARSILELLDNESLRDWLGHAASETVRNKFAPEQIIRQWSHLLEQVNQESSGCGVRSSEYLSAEFGIRSAE